MPRSSATRLMAGVLVSAVAVGWGCSAESPDPTPPAAEAPAAAAVADRDPQPETAPAGVVNYTRVDATVACAGATPPEAMAELKERGFVSVINFRTAGEDGARVEEGRAAAEDAGLRYFHLPFRQATPEVTETFLAAVADPANQPVFIHCGSANRVGAMWLIKRVRVDNWPVEDAIAEAEAIGLRSAALKTFALQYVGSGGA